MFVYMFNTHAHIQIIGLHPILLSVLLRVDFLRFFLMIIVGSTRAFHQINEQLKVNET